MRNLPIFVPLAAILTTAAGCVHVKVDPVKIDATITIKVNRDLEQFFDDLDEKSEQALVDETPNNAPTGDN